MKLKRTLALLASLLLVATVGCSKNGDGDKKNGGSGANVGDDPYTENLEVNNYDGYNFRILIRPSNIADQYVGEGSADPIEDAVYKRNQLVQDMYNITISATESSDRNYETDALNSILAGDDAYDAIFPHARAAFSYAVQGAVLNLNEIDALKLDNPWWSQDIVDSANVNGNLFVLDGDISLGRYSGAMTMFFNKRIFDELGLDYPYQMVKDGEWTFDEFARLTKLGADDLNGDGVMDPENDRYGFQSTEWQSPISFLYTAGQKIYDKNDEGIPELTLNTSKTVDLFDKYFDLMDSEGNIIYLENGTVTGPDLFTEGRAMFHDAGLGSAKSYRNMDDDFGIIPLPKFTEDDDYATIVNGYNHLLIVPITVEDEERTGNIIEALCAIGSRDVVPVFYDQSLKTKFSRDTESEDMIDMIRDSIIYDLGYCAGGTFQSIGRDLAVSSTHDFSSTYAANEAAALFKLKQFNESYGGIED